MINLNKLILSVAKFGEILSFNYDNKVEINNYVCIPTVPTINDIDRDVFVANLTPINSGINVQRLSGTSTITVEDDVMIVGIDVKKRLLVSRMDNIFTDLKMEEMLLAWIQMPIKTMME